MVSHSTETQSDASLPLIADEEETLLRDTVARIVAKYGHDYYQKCSATGEPMQDLWDELGRNGYLGLNIAEEYGGSGAGLTQQAIVSEELAAGGCPELAMVLSQASPAASSDDMERRNRNSSTFPESPVARRSSCSL